MTVSEKTMLWLDRVVWLCIYGGLIAVSAGVYAKQQFHTPWAWILVVNGTTVAMLGFLLIWLCSTMQVRR